MLRWVELILIDPDDEGGVGVLSGGRDDDARRSSLKMFGGLLALGVFAGRFGDDVDREFVPRKVLCTRFGQHLDPARADDHLVAVDRDGIGVATMDRVTSEQTGERFRSAEIVDRHHLELWVEGEG